MKICVILKTIFYRENLQALCLNLLPEIQMRTVKPVIQLYFNLRTNLNESICKVADEVNNLLYPTGTQTSAPTKTVDEGTSVSSNMTFRSNMTPEQEESFKFKVFQLFSVT